MGKDRLGTVDKASVTPVAVIGMACRLPGGINSPDLLWEALLRGDDLVAFHAVALGAASVESFESGMRVAVQDR